jgi:hypothetical protein
LSITSAGNVGIGTNNPVKKLDVAGGVHFGIGTENVSNSSNGLSVQDSSGAGVAIAVGTTTARSTGIAWYDGDPGAAVLYTFTNAAPITITGRDLHLASGGAERLTVTNNGNVGIGTSSPSAKLHVQGSGGGYSGTPGLLVRDATARGTIILESAADVPTDLVMKSNNRLSWSISSRASSDNYNLGFYPSANGTTFGAAALTIATTGGIKFNTYGAGTLITDSSGNVTATSDARMKDISGSFGRGLDAIVNLSPKVYHWNKESGLNTDDVNVGLIAQEVLPYIPEAVSEKDGRYTMSDRPIIAALINAVKELKSDNDALRARLEALES